MGNIFSTLTSITQGLHRDNRPNREFEILNSELKLLTTSNKNCFKINFKRPLNSKKEYYYKLISNETIAELGYLKNQFPAERTIFENKYNYTVLHNKFDKYLKDIARYIKKQKITTDLSNDSDYIINYLKVSAIHLLIELQEQYGNFSNSAKFSIQEIAEKYFYDADFDTSIFEKLEISFPKKIKNSSKPKIKPKNSFGYKNKDTRTLLSVLNTLHFRIDLLQNNTKVEDLHKLLITDDFTKIHTKIYLNCETTQFSYVMDVLKPYFNNLKKSTVEQSNKFITKTGTPLKANNLYKNKVHNPKEKEEIDKIIQQLQ